jgi:hypothetical protein
MVQRRCRLRDGIDSSVELQAACESMPTTPPRNPATQTCYLLCTLCTISHPPDFLSFHRLSFPLRQFSLWILRKIITSGRWGEEPADACAAALSRRGAGRLESALESAGVRAAPRRPTGIGTGIRGRACARGPRRVRGAPRRSTGIRTGIRGRARRPTGIGTGIRGRACARGPRRVRGAPRRPTGIRGRARGAAPRAWRSAPVDWNPHWNPRACARRARRPTGIGTGIRERARVALSSRPRRPTGIRTGIRDRP